MSHFVVSLVLLVLIPDRLVLVTLQAQFFTSRLTALTLT